MKKFLVFILIVAIGVGGFFLGKYLNAEGEQEKYTVSISTNMDAYCTIFGEGEYSAYTPIVISVVPNEGFEFVQWSDGLKSNIREEKVYASNKSFTAQIRAITPTYALDKIEVYVKEYGTLTAKNIEFEYLDIKSNGTTIAKCDMLCGVTAIGKGAEMVSYNTHLTPRTIKIYADEDSPITFYSARNSQNLFTNNTSKSLTLELGVMCHSVYTYNGIEYSDNTSGANHGEVERLNTSVTVTSSSKTQTKVLYTDSTHGYRIMAKLNFVEL